MKAKKLLSMFLSVLMVMSMITVSTPVSVSAANSDIDAKVFTARELVDIITVSNMTNNGLEVKTDNNGHKTQYLQLQSNDPYVDETNRINNHLFSFSFNPNISFDDYPFIKIGYKANYFTKGAVVISKTDKGTEVFASRNDKLMTEAGININQDYVIDFFSTNESCKGNWTKFEFRPYAYKDATSPDGTIPSTSHVLDIEYVAFFKTAADAEAYNYGVGYTVTVDGTPTTTTENNILVDLPSNYENVDGVDYMTVYTDANGNLYSGAYVPTSDITLTSSQCALHVFSAAQLLAGATENDGLMHLNPTLVEENGKAWFRAYKTGPAYNACFRITLPTKVPSDKFEEISFKYRTDKKGKTTTSYFKFTAPAAPTFGYSTKDVQSSEVLRHSASSYGGFVTLDIDPATLNTNLTNDLVNGVAQVNRLKLFPWNATMSDADSATFDLEYIAVFSVDGAAACFDYDSYKTKTVTVLNADNSVNETLSGTYEVGSIINLPAQSGKYMVTYIDADTGAAVDAAYTVTHNATLKIDPSSRTRVILFSAHDQTLVTTNNSVLTKTTETINGVTAYKFTSTTSTMGNDRRINVDFRNGTTPREELTYANYPHMVFGYATNMTAGRNDGSGNKMARLGFTTAPTTDSFESKPDEYKSWEQTLNITPDSIFHNQYFNPSKYSDNSTYNALPVTHMDIRPWGVSATGTIAVGDYVALGYVGFFKTKEQAQAFDYEEYVNAIEVIVKDQNGAVLAERSFNKTAENNTIDLTAYNSGITAPNGKKFIGWIVDGNESNVILTENAASVPVTADVVYTPAFGEKTAVTFYKADGTTSITGEIETTNLTPMKEIVAGTAAAAYEYTKSTEVFAGWQDMTSGTVYGKDSTISGTVSVKATYSKASIRSAVDMWAAKEDGRLTVSGTPSLVEDANGTKLFRLADSKDNAGTKIEYQYVNADKSAIAGVEDMPYVVVRAADEKNDKNNLSTRIAYFKGDTGYTDLFSLWIKSDAKGGAYTKIFDCSAWSTAEVYGYKIAPWAGNKLTDDCYVDIEYIANVEKQSAIEYIDIANMDPITVTLDGNPVTVTASKTLYDAVSNKQYKDEDGYKVVSGFTVNGASQPINYKAQEGDVITTNYGNVYVFTPYMLLHSAQFKNTNGEIVNGNLRITSDQPAGTKYETKAEWADVYAYFQITADNIAEGMNIAADAPLVDFTINSAPYYSITYNTNIDAGTFSNNMYAYYEGKWDRLFPAQTRKTGVDSEFGFDMRTENNMKKADKSKAVTAVRFGIYHQGRLEDADSTNDLSVRAEDYFDIKYLGFFPSAESEAIFDYAKYLEDTKVTVDLTIDGTPVNIGEKYASEMYALPEGTVVAGKEFLGYITNGQFFTDTAYAVAEPVALTSVYKNIVDAADYTVSSGNLANLREAANDGELKVAYIGGSITQGEGASGIENAYAGRVTAAIEAQGITVTPFYMGLGGTGSRLGAHRLADDIIANSPDLVVIDFAINDAYCNEMNGEVYNGIYYEYILRTIRQKLPKTEIIVTLTTDLGNVKNNGSTTQFLIAEKQAELAEYYNATSIDLGRYIAAVMGEEYATVWNVFFADNVHPSNIGHGVYADAIAAYLNNAFTADPAAAAAYEVPADVLYTGAKGFFPGTVALDSVTINGGFEYNESATEGNCYTGKLLPVADAETYAFEFDFKGTELSLYMNSPNEEVNITVAIDGMDPVTVGGRADTNGPKVFYKNLPYGVYHATVSFDQAPEFGGSIIAILVGGEKAKYEVEISATEGGKVSVDGAQAFTGSQTFNVIDGEAINLVATPDAGYKLRNWYDTTNGNNVPLAKDDNEITPADYEYKLTVTKSMNISANFVSEGVELPAMLIAFTDRGSNGKISLNGNDSSYHVDYVTFSNPASLVAVPNEGYYAAYWTRFTQNGNTQVLLNLGANTDGYPLGGEVFYQPVFIADGKTTTLYIDDITNEILGVDAEPASPPTRAGYTFNGFVESASKNGVTVNKTQFTRNTNASNGITVQDYTGKTKTLETKPAFGVSYTITKSAGVVHPVWYMSVNDEDEVIISYADSFTFSYMFKEGTTVVIREEKVDAAPTVTPSVTTVASWTETGRTNFTGAYVLSDEYTVVTNGILMAADSAKLNAITANGQDLANVADGVIVGRISNTTNPTIIYTVAKRHTEGTWYGRAFLTYKDANDNYYTVFGDTIPNA